MPLPYNVEDGMGDFLPPAALKLIAEDYQQGLLDRLNEQIKGAPPPASPSLNAAGREQTRKVPTSKI